MYGSITCSYCQEQKELFGSAFRYVTYVECHPGGENPKPELCDAKGIQGVPAWEIGGRFHLGLHTLEELAELSGFTEAAP